jgi:MarR family
MADRTSSRALSPSGQAGSDELVDTVLAASRALVAVAARSLAAAGDEVTLPQYRALVVLAAQGPQGTAELAAALAVNPSTATRMCDRLVRKGLVRRHRLAGDRRAVRIALTAAGPGPGRRGEQAAPGRTGQAAPGAATRPARAGDHGIPGFRGRGRRASAAGRSARLGGPVTRPREPASARFTTR